LNLLREKLILAAVLLPAAALMLAGAVLAADPLLSLESFGYSGCLMVRCFGLPCPLCGGTEAFAAAFRGDFAAAWAANPFALMFFLTLALAIPALAVAIAWPGSAKPVLGNRFVGIAAAVWGVLLLIILVLAWLARLL
jgi:hypothetical protein